MKLIFCGWILQSTGETITWKAEGVEGGSDDDEQSNVITFWGRSLKQVVSFSAKIGWHHQLPHRVTSTLVTPLFTISTNRREKVGLLSGRRETLCVSVNHRLLSGVSGTHKVGATLGPRKFWVEQQLMCMEIFYYPRSSVVIVLVASVCVSVYVSKALPY